MKTRMKKLLRLGVAGLFAFSLGLAPAIVGSTVANADPTPEPKLPVSSIDLTKRGSITVHKYLTGVPSTIIGTGKADAELPSDAKALENVKFRLKKVPLTPAINTPAGLEAATSMSVDTAKETTKGDAGIIQFTEAGKTTFTNLEPGVYLVTEEMPDKDKADPIPNLTDPNKTIFDPDVHKLIPAAPFLVMIPMTYSSKDEHNNPTSEWNYNVHVFPKNQKSQSTKTVTDKDIQAGSKLTYVISGDVPPIAAGDTLANFELIDDVEKTQLEVTEADVVDVSIVPPTGDSTSLTKTTDYTVALSTSPDKPGKNIVTVTLTTAGLQKVQAATSGALGYKVSMTMTAKVLPVDDTSSEPGHIKNTATVVTNNGSGGADVETPTNETETIYGKLKIHKFAKDGAATEKNLAGAKFQLYYCAEGAEPKTVGEPISVDGTNSWTTGPDGTVVINGLHVTDRIDDKDLVEAGQTPRKYCLVETVAPAGYELLPAPVPVTFTSTELGTESANIAMKTEKIENYPSTTPWLPMTGGPGIIVMVLAGIAIIVGGTVYGLRSRSKK